LSHNLPRLLIILILFLIILRELIVFFNGVYCTRGLHLVQDKSGSDIAQDAMNLFFYMYFFNLVKFLLI